MDVTSSPAYPGADAIRYAVWLKNLALRLPEYASRYQLPLAKVLEMHCLALDYLDILIGRMHQATAHICQHHVLPAGGEPLVGCERTALIQEIAAKLVAHITQHPAYAPADAYELGLPLPEHPPGFSLGFPSSQPNP